MTPCAVFPNCGSPERSSARTSSLRGRNAESGPIGPKPRAFEVHNARQGIGRDEDVRVESDRTDEAHDRRPSRGPKLRRDHATERHAAAEGTGQRLVERPRRIHIAPRKERVSSSRARSSAVAPAAPETDPSTSPRPYGGTNPKSNLMLFATPSCMMMLWSEGGLSPPSTELHEASGMSVPHRERRRPSFLVDTTLSRSLSGRGRRVLRLRARRP
jgi:hypothetical protein